MIHKAKDNIKIWIYLKLPVKIKNNLQIRKGNHGEK